jgi:opacity protein-like surface antigen
MMTHSIRVLRRSIALALALGFSGAAFVEAQAPDFWFQRPNGSIALYGGWSVPRESSDLFDFVREQLTIEQGDFMGPVFGGEVAFSLTRRLDAVLGVEWSGSERRSEDRDYVEPVDWRDEPLPIEQTTEFNTTRLNASGRFYLLDRGRTIGTHAWIPSRWAPYVGGGAGVTWYTFEQYGDFVDYTTVDDPEGAIIFSDRFRSRRSGVGAHALGGLEITVTPRIVLRGEHRYYWGSAAVDSRAFDGFAPIDLAGHRTTIGVATRF